MGRVAALLAMLLGLAACASPPPQGVVHELKRGETVYRLSRFYGVPVEAIVRANDIDDVSNVPVGTRLFIPGASREPPREPLALAAYAPALPSPADPRLRALREADLHFVWPVHGTLSSRFGWRHGHHHDGIDISAKRGSPVHAAEAGRVIFSGRMGGYGRIVIIKHSGDFSTVYAHNRKNWVKVGQFVEKGDLVSEVGATGNASGPHLHFEVRRDRQPENPLAVLPGPRR
jgi:lipoprotein NlpD